MVRIAVDMTHPCDVNFFRRAIRQFVADGHQVHLVVLNRGIVPRLVRHEYPHLTAEVVGVHDSSRLGLYLRTGALRECQLWWALRRFRPDVVLGFPGFQTALVAKALGCRSVGAYDDPEHKPNMTLSRLLCDRLILPDCLNIEGANIVRCSALKEWAYLSPRAFSPNPEVLSRYQVRPYEYLFVREVAARSLNYRPESARGSQSGGAVGRTGATRVQALYDQGLSSAPALLSLEDKARKGLFECWQPLHEPVDDIHSLLFYARAVVSNGDSMAREAAQLGVPSYYVGDREMKANALLTELGLLHHVPEVARAMAALDETSRSTSSDSVNARSRFQQETRTRLDALWDDPGQVVVDTVYQMAE